MIVSVGFTAHPSRYDILDEAGERTRITVEDRGEDTWAVCDGKQCFSIDGKWDFEPLPSSRTNEWKASHRFAKDTALEVAIQVAATQRKGDER